MKQMKIVFLGLFLLIGFTVQADPNLGYDPGPDPSTPEGRGYIDIVNTVPNATYIGRALGRGRDKFRFPFGIMPWRGPTGKNKVKVLVIGQDGTHIAEAAGRPFTGGTGGRVQNALAYIGVRESAMFINTFSYTINGQYSDFAPVLVNNIPRWMQVLNPEGFLLAMDTENPYVKWRNDFIEHIFDSNRDSLKLVFCIGGAARDAFATFVRSRGGEVDYFTDENAVKKNQWVLYSSVHSEQNRSFYFPVGLKGENLLLNSKDEDPDYSDDAVQSELQKRALSRVDRMARIEAGPYQNGTFDLGQFGYDIYSLTVGGKKTLKGLKIKGSPLTADVRVLNFKHPGSVSPDLERNFQMNFDKLNGYAGDGWKFPEVDPGQENKFLAEEKFDYSDKPSIPDEDFPLGKSQALIINDSLASRPDKQIIAFGGRGVGFFKIDERMKKTLRKTKTEYVYFEGNETQKVKSGTPSEGLSAYAEIQPWNPAPTKSDFDRGPGKEWAELFNSIPLDKVFEPKSRATSGDDDDTDRNEDMSFEKDGIAAFNVKSHPDHGAFGFFRGTVEKPEVLVVADPSTRDLDDLYTARALTGEVGQKIQGLMEGLGTKDNYLVIKTLPFDMTDATDSEWKASLKVTDEWRSKVIRKALALKPKLILTWGRYADAEMKRTNAAGVRVVSLTAGFKSAFDEIQKDNLLGRKVTFHDDMRSIPRNHLPFPIQAWVGTSGTRGIRAQATGLNEALDLKTVGKYYGIVVPSWVLQIANKPVKSKVFEETRFIENATKRLEKDGFAKIGWSTEWLKGHEPREDLDRAVGDDD